MFALACLARDYMKYYFIPWHCFKQLTRNKGSNFKDVSLILLLLPTSFSKIIDKKLFRDKVNKLYLC